MPTKDNEVTALHRFLDKMLLRAKHDNSTGDQRTHGLEDELSRIAERVDKTIAEINHQYETSTSPNVDEHIQNKLERTMEILTIEMVQLAAVYHRQSDVNRIRSFLNAQRDTISQTLNDGGKTGGKSLVSLDSQISDLHQMMHEERRRIKQTARKESLKFWLTFSIGLVSLSVSLYAILR